MRLNQWNHRLPYALNAVAAIGFETLAIQNIMLWIY